MSIGFELAANGTNKKDLEEDKRMLRFAKLVLLISILGYRINSMRSINQSKNQDKQNQNRKHNKQRQSSSGGVLIHSNATIKDVNISGRSDQIREVELNWLRYGREREERENEHEEWSDR